MHAKRLERVINLPLCDLRTMIGIALRDFV